MAECPLCKAERKTRWYYEDELVWVADCETCGIPMIVWREHTMTVPLSGLIHMCMVIGKLFGNARVRVKQRKIKDHLHWHIEL